MDTTVIKFPLAPKLAGQTVDLKALKTVSVPGTPNLSQTTKRPKEDKTGFEKWVSEQLKLDESVHREKIDLAWELDVRLSLLADLHDRFCHGRLEPTSLDEFLGMVWMSHYESSDSDGDAMMVTAETLWDEFCESTNSLEAKPLDHSDDTAKYSTHSF